MRINKDLGVQLYGWRRGLATEVVYGCAVVWRSSTKHFFKVF